MAKDTTHTGNVRSGPPQVGDAVGPFTVTELGTSGAFGQEYFAQDPETGDKVVIRFLPRLVLHAGEEVVRAFLQEAQAAAGARHSNLCRLLKVGKDGGELYVVTEFAEGTAEADIIGGGEPLSPREATRVVREVALALSAVHRQGLTHRDCQPANIVRGADGRIRLTQLGIVRGVEELQQFRLGIPIATAAFCSPELYQAGNIDGRTDIYSLGATYFMLLTGRAPFIADTSMQVLHKHSTEPAPDPRQVRPEIPEGCFKFIKKAMAKRPEERFATAEQMAGDLAKLLHTFPAEEEAAADPISAGLAEAVSSPAGVSTTRIIRGGPTRMLTGYHKAIPSATGAGGSSPMIWLAAGGAVVVILLVVVAVNLMDRGGPARDKDKGRQPAKAGGGEPAPETKQPEKIDIGLIPDSGTVPIRSDPPPDTTDPEKGKTETVVARPPVIENEPEPALPPAEAGAALFSDRLVGWRHDGPGWSAAGGTVAGDHKDGRTQLIASTPAASFDVTLMVHAVSAEAAGLEFHHGPAGLCRLSLAPGGFLRLQRVRDTEIEQLGTKGLSPGKHRLRVIVRGRRIEVFADGHRAIPPADVPAGDPTDPQLVLFSLKGRSEFSAGRWSPLGADPRREALIAMSRFGDPAVVPHLRSVLTDRGAKPELLVDAVGMLARLSDAKAVESVRAFAARDDVAVEALRAAVAALGAVGGDTAQIERRLGHGDAGVRAAAVAALVKLSPGAIDKIIPMLGDRDAGVRRTAIGAVSRLRSDAALPALAGALRDPNLRSDAVAALLSLAEPADEWTVLEPVSAESSGGTTFTILNDGSLLAGGPKPDRDTYTMTFRTPLKKITGLRVEALTDPSLPHTGPGRADNGNIVLNDLRATAAPASGGPAKPVAFKRAFADRVQADFPADHAIDNDPKTGWAIASWTHHQPCSLFLETAEDLGFDGGTIVTLRLDQQFGGQHAIGRLRLRATTAARPLALPGTGASPTKLASNPIFIDALVAGLVADPVVRNRCIAEIRRASAQTPTLLHAAAAAGRLTPAHIAALRSGLSAPVAVRDLHLAGPFPVEPTKDLINVPEFIKNPDYSKKYAGVPGREAIWRKATADDSGHVNVREFMQSDQKWAVYGHFTVDSPHEGDTECRFEVDDELTLWVNGDKLSTQRIGGERTVPLRLRKGVNHVVFRADNDGGGDWWFRLKIGRGGIPPELSRPSLLALIEDDDALIPHLNKDTGQISLETGDKYSGGACLRVTPGQRYNERVPDWSFPVVENPGVGQYRWLRFAWKKRGGTKCAVQIAADGAWEKDGKGWRFFAGDASPWGSAKVLAGVVPEQWQVYTFDLFKEMGAFNITGLAITPQDGEYMLLDHVYLARTADEFKKLPAPGK